MRWPGSAHPHSAGGSHNAGPVKTVTTQPRDRQPPGFGEMYSAQTIRESEVSSGHPAVGSRQGERRTTASFYIADKIQIGGFVDGRYKAICAPCCGRAGGPRRLGWDMGLGGALALDCGPEQMGSNRDHDRAGQPGMRVSSLYTAAISPSRLRLPTALMPRRLKSPRIVEV